MKNFVKIALIASFVTVMTGCTGSVYNKEKDCNYDYLLHPAVSISKIIGGCGGSNKKYIYFLIK
uniref:YhfL family protein n=1 Tax=Proteus mirabilis TaxID=584 RepID=UPI001B3655DB